MLNLGNACRVQSGYTLLEMMIVLTIVGILAAVALPNFRDSIQSSRIVSASNEITSAISMARSEAIKSGKAAGICPSTNGTACGGSNWQTGWIVWVDQDIDNAVDAGETVVRYQQALNKVQFTAVSTPAVSVISFNSRGLPRTALPADFAFTLQPPTGECKAGRLNIRTLTILAGGGVKSVKGACS